MRPGRARPPRHPRFHYVIPASTTSSPLPLRHPREGGDPVNNLGEAQQRAACSWPFRPFPVYLLHCVRYPGSLLAPPVGHVAAKRSPIPAAVSLSTCIPVLYCPPRSHIVIPDSTTSSPIPLRHPREGGDPVNNRAKPIFMCVPITACCQLSADALSALVNDLNARFQTSRQAGRSRPVDQKPAHSARSLRDSAVS